MAGAIGVFLCLAVLMVAQKGTHAVAGTTMKREVVTLVTASGRHEIMAEIADQPALQSRGLMFRRTLAPDAGMLFVYDKSEEVTMWMKNTILSLDMVFIRPDGIVHRIEHNTEPFSESTISSQGDVLAVLELNAGSAERLGLRVGDRVEHAAFSAR